jgi:hypothetical protein
VSGVAYGPRDGVLVLSGRHLQALVARPGRSVDPSAARDLHAAGLLVDGRVDPPLLPIVEVLRGGGPRLRLASRCGGRVSVTTAAVGASGAALLVLPPGGGELHVRYLSPGGLARHLARRLGVGPTDASGGREVASDDTLDGPVRVGGWGELVGAFRTASPSGWASGWRGGELHELRWVARPGVRARTALVTGRLGRLLVEVQPDGDGYVVAPADPVGVWVRLSALVSGEPSRCGQPPPPPRPRGAGRGLS